MSREQPSQTVALFSCFVAINVVAPIEKHLARSSDASQVTVSHPL